MKKSARNTVTNIRPKDKSAVRNGGSLTRPATAVVGGNRAKRVRREGEEAARRTSSKTNGSGIGIP